MQIVVPMAGAGRRFADRGYSLPKPLIPIDGVPMVVRAVRDLPKSSRVVLVCNADHVRDYQIDNVLAKWLPDCQVVVAPGLTEGQACTVALAAEHLTPDEPVLVAACDNTHAYDPQRFAALVSEPQLDAAIWTYRGEARVLVKPRWYGWVSADDQGRVQRVGVKRTVSDAPKHDDVISGTFWFQSARFMLDSIARLVANDLRVNGEFYLDSVAALLVAEGRNLKVFRTDKYIGWGTPDELDDYCRWRDYFARRAA